MVHRTGWGGGHISLCSRGASLGFLILARNLSGPPQKSLALNHRGPSASSCHIRLYLPLSFWTCTSWKGFTSYICSWSFPTTRQNHILQLLSSQEHHELNCFLEKRRLSGAAAGRGSGSRWVWGASESFCASFATSVKGRWCCSAWKLSWVTYICLPPISLLCSHFHIPCAPSSLILWDSTPGTAHRKSLSIRLVSVGIQRGTWQESGTQALQTAVTNVTAPPQLDLSDACPHLRVMTQDLVLWSSRSPKPQV